MKKSLKSIPTVGKLILATVIIFLVTAIPAYAQDVPNEDQIGQIFVILLVLAIPEILGWTAFTLIWRGLFPRRLNYTSRIVRRLSWSSFWFGLTSVIVLLAVLALLASISEALLLLVFLILAVYLVMFVSFGKIAVIEWIGEVVDPSSTGMRRIILGVSAIYVLLFVPFIGWLLVFGLAMMGVGAAIYSWFPSPAPAQPMIQQPNEELSDEPISE